MQKSSLLSLNGATNTPELDSILNSTSEVAQRARGKKVKSFISAFNDRSGKSSSTTYSSYKLSHARSQSNTTKIFITETQRLPLTNESDYCTTSPSTSSSSKTSTTSSPKSVVPSRFRELRNSKSKEIDTSVTDELKEQILKMKTDFKNLQTYTKNLEENILTLTKRVDEMQQQQESEKLQKKAKFAAWTNLTNFFKHRPTIEELKKNNVYKNEPCFDTELELVSRHETHTTIPKIVVVCCDIIEKRIKTSDANVIMGIYRQCGDYTKMQTLRFQIDNNDYDSLLNPKIDIHTLAGVLKLFLREIKSPLISVNEARAFIGKPKQWLLMNTYKRIDILKCLIRTLPEIHRDTMKYLFSHFNRLTKIPLKHISSESLSISVAPAIFHSIEKEIRKSQSLEELIVEGEQLADCVRIMIEFDRLIFECWSDGRKRCSGIERLRKTLSQSDLLFTNLF